MGAPDAEEKSIDEIKSAEGMSPLRVRILRLCLHQARSSAEIASELDVAVERIDNEIRSLASLGFLVTAQPGATSEETRYRATGRSWNNGGENIGPLLVETFLQEIEGLPAEELQILRIGLKLNEANRKEMSERFQALFVEYKDREPDQDGQPISLMFAEHPEWSREQRAKA